MSANFLRLPDDLTERYKATAQVLNAERAQKGLKPIKPTELQRIVLARVVGLPVLHEVDLDAVTAAAKKAPAKRTSKKAPAKKAPAKRTSKKAPAKKTSTSEMWTPPHGG